MSALGSLGPGVREVTLRLAYVWLARCVRTCLIGEVGGGSRCCLVTAPGSSAESS